MPCGSVDAALAALRAGEVDGAMVPIENSVEGGVTATLDALASGDPLVVIGEVLVPITFVLAARPGTALADVRAVGTHPHALGPGPRLDGRAPARTPTYVPTLSTAAAADGAGRRGRAAAYDAAVCAPVAARDCTGSRCWPTDIGDNAGGGDPVRAGGPARRRCPSRPGRTRPRWCSSRRDDHAGGLLELLEQFAARGINLTRLESRPTGESMGAYCFSIDFEGHVLDERVGEALMGLRRICAEVRFLGSYPRADGSRRGAPRTSDADFIEAREWLRTLRHPT